MRDPATRSPMHIPGRPANRRGKGLLRILLLVIAAVATVAIASYYGVARDYGYLRAMFLTGSPGGNYHALGRSLAARAGRGHGSISVVATAGSVENANRLSRERSTATFALVQDGIPRASGWAGRNSGPAASVRVAAASGAAGPHSLGLCRFARSVDRDWP